MFMPIKIVRYFPINRVLLTCILFFLIVLHFSFPAKEKLFPVADATTFFTDLHHILKVIAAGNIRTLCHHRLVLLEQVDAPFYYKLSIFLF